MPFHSFSGLEDLKAGQRIKIKGKFMPEGKFLALEIKHKPEKELLEFEGLVQAVDAGTHTVSMFNRNVSLTPAVLVKSPEGKTLTTADITEGDYIKIKFKKEAGNWVPFKIKKREPLDFIVEEIQGAIDSVDVQAGELRLQGIQIRLSDDTTIEE